MRTCRAPLELRHRFCDTQLPERACCRWLVDWMTVNTCEKGSCRSSSPARLEPAPTGQWKSADEDRSQRYLTDAGRPVSTMIGLNVTDGWGNHLNHILQDDLKISCAGLCSWACTLREDPCRTHGGLRICIQERCPACENLSNGEAAFPVGPPHK